MGEKQVTLPGWLNLHALLSRGETVTFPDIDSGLRRTRRIERVAQRTLGTGELILGTPLFFLHTAAAWVNPLFLFPAIAGGALALDGIRRWGLASEQKNQHAQLLQRRTA